MGGGDRGGPTRTLAARPLNERACGHWICRESRQSLAKLHLRRSQGGFGGFVTATRGKPSIRQLAERLGISVATVSRVLNNGSGVSEATRRRVMEAATAAGYTSDVGKRPTNFVALLYADDEPPHDFGGFESLVIAGSLETCTARGFNLAILSAAKDKHPAETYPHFLRRKGISAALIRGREVHEAASQLAEAEFPAIVVAGRCERPGVSYIDAQSRSTSRQAIDHLIRLGHRRIAVAVRRDPDLDHAERLAGYRDALETAGIEVDERLITVCDRTQRSGGAAIDRLLALTPSPTAVYFTTPLATVGALYRCAELGVGVPEDLSIVGFDEAETRQSTFPRYTAVCQDARGLATEATEWLIRRVSGGPTEPCRVVRETKLSVLHSTGPAG